MLRHGAISNVPDAFSSLFFHNDAHRSLRKSTLTPVFRAGLLRLAFPKQRAPVLALVDGQPDVAVIVFHEHDLGRTSTRHVEPGAAEHHAVLQREAPAGHAPRELPGHARTLDDRVALVEQLI